MRGIEHVQAKLKEDNIKLEPNVATALVASTVAHPWYGMVKRRQ